MFRIQIQFVIGLFLAAWGATSCHSQGALLSAGGPIHRGMGGASVAAPNGAIGSLYWNPAAISGLRQSELEVGLDLLSADHEISSTAGPFAGSTEGDAGVFPIPNFGWVQRLSDPRWTFGLGVNSIAGFKTNVPSDVTNPVLAPAPTGLGAISSEATFLQIAPVLSFAASDRLSFGVGPTITTGQVAMEPFVVDAANANGTYSSGRSGRYHWGGGAQAGVFYTGASGVNLGASIKSPVWMEQFEFQSRDENGLPRTLTADIDLPMIVSLGLGLVKYEGWIFAADFRYIDYENTDGFGDPASFQADGSLSGLDWRSVFASAFGVERQMGERVAIRCGYSYNQSPINNSESFYNIATPLFYEHTLSIGGSYYYCQNIAVSTAYSHYFENEVTGPIVSPSVGPLPGTSVTNRVGADVVSFGVSFQH